jgi:hypothetical protein
MAKNINYFREERQMNAKTPLHFLAAGLRLWSEVKQDKIVYGENSGQEPISIWPKFGDRI